MITTHVLDTSRGAPAAGMKVVLEVRQTSEWKVVGGGTTDADGRLAPLAQGSQLVPGTYRLTFDTGEYHSAHAMAAPFFPAVTVTFSVRDAAARYHVPLLLSPYGYSTYRGT